MTARERGALVAYQVLELGEDGSVRPAKPVREEELLVGSVPVHVALDQIGLLQQAMVIAEQVKPLERRVFDAHRAGEIKADDIPGQIDEAEKKGILTPAEAEAVRAFDQRMLDVTGVDDFDPSDLRRHGA
jgi:acyl-CoA dehydrogenase